MLRDDGMIIVNEPTQHYEISLIVDAFRGVQLSTVDNNSHTRQYGTYFTRSQLEEVFEQAGYRLCIRQVTAFVNLRSCDLYI